eukprot:6462086-Amphidinium_carterae.1
MTHAKACAKYFRKYTTNHEQACTRVGLPSTPFDTIASQAVQLHKTRLPTISANSGAMSFYRGTSKAQTVKVLCSTCVTQSTPLPRPVECIIALTACATLVFRHAVQVTQVPAGRHEQLGVVHEAYPGHGAVGKTKGNCRFNQCRKPTTSAANNKEGDSNCTQQR